MLRFYFDENAGDAGHRVDLGPPGALRDIAPVAGRMQDGLRVNHCDDASTWVGPESRFDRGRQRWMGVPFRDTTRRLAEPSYHVLA